MGNELTKRGATQGALVSRRSDASDDVFVTREMARGEVIVRAAKYTQTPAACGLQLAAVGVPLGLMATLAVGSALVGLAVMGGSVLGLGLAMLLETSNRVVVTTGALVVQSSVFLRRYALERISGLRVERLGIRDWIRFDVLLMEPRFFFVAAPGIRFTYRQDDGRDVEVFVGVADAQSFVELLRSRGAGG